MKISCIIPVHNEEKSLEAVVEDLKSVLYEHSELADSFEIIIVDDNSNDATPDVIKNLCSKDSTILVVKRDAACGFGKAIKDGIQKSRGDVIIFLMGDRSDDPIFIPEFLKKIKEGFDVIYGSRFIKGASINDYPLIKMLCNRLYNNLARILFCIRHKDITNAFKAYKKEVISAIGFDNLESDEFDISAEIALKASTLGFKSVEVPVSWRNRSFGEAKFKINKTGVAYLRCLFKVLAWRRKYNLDNGYKYFPVKYSYVHWHYAKRKSDFIRQFIKPGFKILDVGCGSGAFIELLKANCNNIVGIDMSNNAVMRADRNLKNKSIIAADALALPFKEKIFDLIYASNIFHHIADLSKIEIAIGEMACAAKDYIILFELNPRNIFCRYFLFKMCPFDSGKEHIPGKTQITDIANKLGLKMEKIAHISFLPLFIPRFLCGFFSVIESICEKFIPSNSVGIVYLMKVK